VALSQPLALPPLALSQARCPPRRAPLTACLPSARPPAFAAAPSVYIYNSTISALSYILNTEPTNFTSAEEWCKLSGGHLVSYTSLAEQAEVGAG
jgi:hypothetical protein